jgi:hypothetical protein
MDPEDKDLNFEIQEEVPQDNEPTVEDQAREMGWVPKDEFDPKDGKKDKWVSAEAFVARAPLFEKIESQKKTIEAVTKAQAQTQKILKEFAAHHERVAKDAYERAKADLKAQRRLALNEGEHDLAEDIQERLDALKPDPVPEVPEVEANPTAHLVAEWLEENKWYNQDDEMRAVADGIARNEAAKGKSQEDVLKTVASKVKKMFSEHFEHEPTQKRNPNKDTAPPVESRNTRSSVSKNTSRYSPSAFERQAAANFVAQGLYKNVEEYYAELAKLN